MSTRLTKNNIPMVDSHSLKLVFCSAKTNELISQYLSKTLTEKGYVTASPSVLGFLSALECGVNYGSEIARNLNVSRQMVAKTVKELCRVGYLEQVDGPGKQKQILFTKQGEHLMADARQILAQLDQIFAKSLGNHKLNAICKDLETIQKLIEQAG